MDNKNGLASPSNIQFSTSTEVLRCTNLYITDITYKLYIINPLSTNPTKGSNTLKQFIGKLPTNYLSVFDHFVKLAFKGLRETVKCLLLTLVGKK